MMINYEQVIWPISCVFIFGSDFKTVFFSELFSFLSERFKLLAYDTSKNEFYTLESNIDLSFRNVENLLNRDKKKV